MLLAGCPHVQTNAGAGVSRSMQAGGVTGSRVSEALGLETPRLTTSLQRAGGCCEKVRLSGCCVLPIPSCSTHLVAYVSPWVSSGYSAMLMQSSSLVPVLAAFTPSAHASCRYVRYCDLLTVTLFCYLATLWGLCLFRRGPVQQRPFSRGPVHDASGSRAPQAGRRRRGGPITTATAYVEGPRNHHWPAASHAQVCCHCRHHCSCCSVCW